MNDTIHTIRRSSHLFFSGTVLSRIAGMLRDVSMAYVFGTQPAVAAFMIAFRFSHLLRRVFGEGAMQSAFVPEFESLRHQNEQRAFTFFRDLTATVAFFLTLLILIVSGALMGCLYWGNFTLPQQEIMRLTLIMLPSLLFICLFGINASLLQCERSYFTSSVAPVAFNIIWIIIVLNLRTIPSDQAMLWLSGGVVCACIGQWLITLPRTLSILKRQLQFPFWQSIQMTSPDLRQLITPLFLGILGVSASQINNAIDPLFAWHANPEGPAFLWYAIRLQQLPLALFGVAIAGAILPPLSRALKADRNDEYHELLQYAFHRTWNFILPITAALFMMGDTSISLLYGRGDFGAESIIGTTQCLWAYGIGLLPATLILVLAPACYAHNHYRLTTYASFFNLSLNICLNSLFIFFFGWGAASVALATSISAWGNFYFLSQNVSNKGTDLFSGLFNPQGLGICLATLCACLGTYWIRWVVQDLPFFAETLLQPGLFIEKSFALCIQISTFGAIFLIGMLINKR